jgi:peroxiredoxin
MAQLRQDYQGFIDRDTEVIAIGPEDAESFASWWHEKQMPFIGIADPGHIVAQMYGQQVKILRLGRMPASMVIDKQGLIRYRHYGESMSDIPTDEEILSLLGLLNQEEESDKD